MGKNPMPLPGSCPFLPHAQTAAAVATLDVEVPMGLFLC